jgi:hypothetical protein
MKTKTIKTTLISILFAVLMLSCNDDFLDRKPLNIISSDAVFSDETLTTSYLYTIYNYMPVGYGGYLEGGLGFPAGFRPTGYGITDILDGSTDLARSPSNWNENNSVMIPGIISATNNPLGTWNRSYEAIRKVNNMIFNLTSGSLDDEFKNRIIAEAKFVRAFFYFDLARRYGDVPLIEELQDFSDFESLLVARNPVAEVYDFIDAELTSIADQLPSASNLPSSELGRATKEACWALNGRSLLYAKNYTKSASFSKKVIDANHYVLSADYNALFQSYGGNNEVIFEVLFDGTEKTKGHIADALYRPYSLVAGQGFGSQTNPTQELVDSYEMLNGLPISDPGSGYNAQDPYINRDKRFEASVLHHGSVVKGVTINVDVSPSFAPIGNDAPGQPDRSITGYYMRKFIDENLPLGVNVFLGQSKVSWKELRFGEVLLNYAEAQNEAVGPDASVYGAINQVRSRAGLPDLPAGLTKDEMFLRIIQERKVELAFEGHRFWDLRRWEIAEQVLNNKTFNGGLVVNTGSGLTYGTFSLSLLGNPNQIFLPKHYLMPIPLDEIQKNKNLTQNAGY